MTVSVSSREDDTERAGAFYESEKPCEPRETETPLQPAAQPRLTRPSLPVTGGDVAASVLAVSALAIGAILSIVVRGVAMTDSSTGRCAVLR